MSFFGHICGKERLEISWKSEKERSRQGFMVSKKRGMGQS